MNAVNDSTAVACPWDGMTIDEKTAALAAKLVAQHGMCIGAGEFYVMQFKGAPMFVPVEHFDGFAAAVLNAD